LFIKEAELFNFSKEDSHKGDVTIMLWQAQMYDGVLISASADGNVKLWMRDAQFHHKFVCCQTIVAHQGTILAVAASPQTSMLATSSTDRLIKIWSQRGGRDLLFYPFYECLQTLTEHISTRTLDVNSLGTWVATLSWKEGDELLLFAGDSEGSINIFTQSNEAGVPRFKLDRKSGLVHRLLISGMLIVPQENFMFTAGFDHYLKGLDATNGSEFVAIRNYNKVNFTALVWDNAHKELIAGDEIGFLGIWNAYQERPIYWGCPLDTSQKILKLEVDESGGQILILTQLMVHVMKINRGQRSHDITGHSGPVLAISVQAASQVHRFYSNEKPRFFTASLDNTIRVWDYSDLSTIAVLEAPDHTEITSMCFLPVSNLIATGHDTGDVMLWNPELKVSVTLDAPDKHNNTVTCVIGALYNDTEYLITVGYDAKICIWEVIEKAVAMRQAAAGSSGITVFPTLRTTLLTTAHKTYVSEFGEELLTVAFHDLGRKSSLITAGNSGEVQVWDMQTFEFTGSMTVRTT
jgi:WD40 repeat protein